ncbi:phosphonate ABC transporter ATP-binding protein [Marinomonas sp. C2222]|uniref:Phosphonate ABC transporter ATP-binding protein n=1 Tax=Marinomonas sargassi TaxID=2984494 RepID=A0ABT2YPJ5_9GAMM|nr:phosphonate ABC transporter ATP-binding protein [Marinomonas sargassi]MCV2401816.1 phosphonate ABC transporter ATP-binding protein [Marinomonas sargassi]
MSIIEIDKVTKHFSKEIHALKDISLTIEKGEMVALIGSSGSGKSTLMRHVSGLTLADKNSQSAIKVLSNSIQQGGKLDRNIRTSRAQIGNVFQQFNLVNRLSVLTNVMIGALSRTPSYRSLLGHFTTEEKHLALEALERVGLKNVVLKRASELSGGQQQRVAIARALMQKAEVILADEPIASLDPESSRLVMQTLKDINEKDGITVVVTLHQVDYAQKYCRRAVALKDGAIFYDGQIQHLNDDLLASLYGAQHTPEETSTELDMKDLNGILLAENGRINPKENHSLLN